MPRMPESEVKFWQEELAHAHAVWGAKGLSRHPVVGGQEKDTAEEEIYDFIDAYRGEQWKQLGGMRGARDDLATTPLFFASANTFQAGLMARAPRVDVLPRKRGAARDARVVEALLNYDVHDAKFHRQYNRALVDSFFTPFGIVRLGYTPEEEYRRFVRDDEQKMESFDPVRPGKPWVRRVKIWDFRCDPLAETPDSDGDARWCAFRSLMTLDQIKQNPNMIFREDLKPSVTMDVREQRKHAFGMSRRSPKTLDYVEVWHIYDKMERKWFAFAHGHEKPIREPEDWPKPFEGIDGLPYDALYFNEQMDQMFPIPYAAAVWPTIVERNKVRTIFMRLVKSMRRLGIVDEDALADGEFDKLATSDLTEILRSKGLPQNVLHEFTTGGFDSSLLALDALHKEDVREALGQSQFNRGQRANVESGTEAALIGQGDVTNHGRNVARLEDFLNSSLRHYAQARQATADVEEMVAVVGMEDTDILRDGEGVEYIRATPEQIKGEFDFRVRAGSTLPKTREQEVQEAKEDLMVTVQGFQLAPELFKLRHAYLKYYIARGQDPTKWMTTDTQIDAQIPGQMPGEAAAQAQNAGPDILGPLLQAANAGSSNGSGGPVQ